MIGHQQHAPNRNQTTYMHALHRRLLLVGDAGCVADSVTLHELYMTLIVDDKIPLLTVPCSVQQT